MVRPTLLKQSSKWLKRCFCLLFSALFIASSLACGFAEKQVKKSQIESSKDDGILRGSISKKEWYEEPSLSGKVYRPKNWLVKKADRLAKEYKLGAAEHYYRLVLKTDPKNAGAHNGLGKIYYQRTTSSNQAIRKNTESLHNRAIQEFITALRYEPNYAEAHLNLGKMYLEQGRMEDAKEYFANALALNPKYSDAQEMIGQVLLSEGAVNDAIPFLQQSIELNSANASAHYLLGKAYTQRGEYERAYEELNIALYQNPNSAPTHHQMGLVYEHQGNGAAAVNEFKKAITIKPEYAEASLRLSKHYENRGDYVLAVEQLKNTLEGIPHYKDQGYYDLTQRIAKMHLAQRQPDEAIPYYQKILRYWGDDSTAQKGMSQATLLKTQMELALAVGYGGDILSTTKTQMALEKSLAYDPTNIKAKMIQVKLNGGSRELTAMNPATMSRSINNPAYTANQSIARGEVWTARFDYKRAEQEFNSALSSVSKTEDIIMLGEMLLDMGQPDLAIQAFNRASSQRSAQNGLSKAQESKTASRSKVREALIYKKSDYSSEKRRILDDAVNLNHKNAEAHLMLAELYAQYKNYPWAIRHYHVYLSLNPPPKEAKKIKKRIMRLAKKRAS